MSLDDAQTFARLDRGHVAASIEALPDQIADAWREASRIRVPAAFRKAANVVVSGMGGSTLGADLIRSVYGDALRVPFSFINDYRLPGWVGKSSLVVLSSYSGTTEETLACFREAKKRGAKVMGITTGDPLAKLLRATRAPSYIFKPKHNPSGAPRLALGYMATGLLALLSRAGILKVDERDMRAIPEKLAVRSEDWRASVPAKRNQAKLLARTLAGSAPVFVAAEHLVGNAHILQNQVHESAKNFSACFPLPELNHHLLEGLKLPAAMKKILTFVLFDSKLYSDRLRQRLMITAQVIDRQKYTFHEFMPTFATRLGQAFETLAFGSAVSFFMAMQNRVDPSDIPWVVFFKSQLQRG